MDGGPRLLDIAAIRSLPRSTTAWEMSLRDAPAEADRARMYRLLIIVSAGANTIRLMRATTERTLSAGALVEALEQAMTQEEGDLVPARPPAVHVDSQELLDALDLPMKSCGVEVRLKALLPAIDPVIEALGQKPGLFSERTLIGTSCYEAELAEAAARLASAEPWRYFAKEQPFVMVTAPDGNASVLVVLGTLHHTLGIAGYDTLEDYDAAREVMPMERSPGEPMPFNGWVLTFTAASSTKTPLRHAITQRGLPIAHALFPHFRVFHRGEAPLELTDRNDARRVEHHLHAAVALIDEQGEAILDGTWTSSRFELPGGTVELAPHPDHAEVDRSARLEEDLDDDSSPFMDEPDFDDGMSPIIPRDHAMLVMDAPAAYITHVAPELKPHLSGDIIPCLVIRATKKNAAAAAKAVAQLDGLAFVVKDDFERHFEVILGIERGNVVGVVSLFGTHDDQPTLGQELKEALAEPRSHVVVLFLGGGTRRPPSVLRRQDVIAALRLQLVELS